MTLLKAKPAPRWREHGGDNEVERDGHGRPRIRVGCDRCDGTGRQPSQKRPGNTVQCGPCKGKGERKVAYTRCTTFIDALDDKSQLGTWKARMVLIGVAMDSGFLKDVLSMDPEDKDDRNTLNVRAEAAAKLAGAEEKANHGTTLHEYSEVVDRGEPLPPEVPIEDWAQIQSYAAATQSLLEIRHMERLVVNDEYRVGGTPDRVSTPREGVTLVAPNGYVFERGEYIITDLKTGRVDYGALKMAMQLSVYAHSELYIKGDDVPLAETRVSQGPVNRKWGIIMHSPADSGITTLYWADLELGWRAVAVAREVRELRRIGKNNALTEFAPDGTTTFFKKAA